MWSYLPLSTSKRSTELPSYMQVYLPAINYITLFQPKRFYELDMQINLTFLFFKSNIPAYDRWDTDDHYSSPSPLTKHITKKLLVWLQEAIWVLGWDCMGHDLGHTTRLRFPRKGAWENHTSLYRLMCSSNTDTRHLAHELICIRWWIRKTG